MSFLTVSTLTSALRRKCRQTACQSTRTRRTIAQTVLRVAASNSFLRSVANHWFTRSRPSRLLQ